MARREELQIFSTSFIDLMACSLAGACILWILTLDAAPAVDEPPTRRSVWVSVTQSGRSHFDPSALRLDADGASWTLDDFAAGPRTTSRGATVQLAFEKPGAGDDSTYGGRLNLLVENSREELVLRFAFGTCTAKDDLHSIRLDIADRDGSRSDYFFSTEPTCLSAALGIASTLQCAFSLPARAFLLEDLARAVALAEPRPTVRALDVSASPTWRVVIGADGRVAVETPPEDPASTARIASALAAASGSSGGGVP